MKRKHATRVAASVSVHQAVTVASQVVLHCYQRNVRKYTESNSDDCILMHNLTIIVRSQGVKSKFKVVRIALVGIENI